MERRQIADQSRNEERFDTIFKAMDGRQHARRSENAAKFRGDKKVVFTSC